jgi:Ser/Thr protein kinase RdoA (MazF antagonist)
LRSRFGDTKLLQWLRLRSWAKAALKQYGLQDARFTLVKEGINQRKLLFRVESPTRGRFLLRVYKLSRPNENLMPELLWLQALGREMPIPEPIPAADGSLASLLSPKWALEPRRCVLLRWLPGGFKRDDLTPTNLSVAGSQVARLHRYSEQYGVPEGATFPYVWDWEWIFGEEVPLWSKGESVYSKRELDVFRATAERVRQDLQELGKNGDVYGIIHRDLHVKNFLFHEGEVYVLDFEKCGWGYYLFDLTVTLSVMESHKKNRAPRQAAFIEGYQRERPLPEDHWRCLETFMAMRVVQRVNMVLSWKTPTWRAWGPSALPGSVEGLKEFLASKRKAGPVDPSPLWWRRALRK